METRFAAPAAIVLIGAFALSGCVRPANKDKIADIVAADAAQLVAEFNAHDAEKAVDHGAPGHLRMVHGTPNAVGPGDILVLTRALLADPASHLVVSNETVDVASAGDMAVYRAKYAYTRTDPATKQPVTETGNWLLGYRRREERFWNLAEIARRLFARKQRDAGNWKIEWSVASDIGPAPAAK